MKLHKNIPLSLAVGLAAFPVLAIVKPVNAAFMNYSVEYDPVNKISIFSNSSDSLAPLRTFSLIVNPTSLGGAYNPIYVGPGDSIMFFADGSYTLMGDPKPAIRYVNGSVDPNKTWDFSIISPDPDTQDEVIKKWIPDPQDPTKGQWGPWTNTAKTSDWFYVGLTGVVTITNGNTNFSTRVPATDLGLGSPTKLHIGAEDPGQFVPPNPTAQNSFEPVPPNFFEEDAPSILLASGSIQVPRTDTLDFMSVSTLNAGAGSVAIIPEPTSALSLLALGTIGAVSTLKRKLKPSQSSEKETTKVG